MHGANCIRTTGGESRVSERLICSFHASRIGTLKCQGLQKQSFTHFTNIGYMLDYFLWLDYFAYLFQTATTIYRYDIG